MAGKDIRSLLADKDIRSLLIEMKSSFDSMSADIKSMLKRQEERAQRNKTATNEVMDLTTTDESINNIEISQCVVSWPNRVEDVNSEPLSGQFALSLKSHNEDIQCKTRFTVIEGIAKNSNKESTPFPKASIATVNDGSQSVRRNAGTRILDTTVHNNVQGNSTLGALDSNDVGSLYKLTQTTTVADYQVRFDELKTLLWFTNKGLNEQFFVDSFINGLKEEIKHTVQRFGPELLDDAINLAKLHEAVMGPVKKVSQLANTPAAQFSSDVPGSNVLKFSDHVISPSKDDIITSVPSNKATYANAILPLADLETRQLPLVQSCVFPKMVSVSDDIRVACTEAKRRLQGHIHVCSNQECVHNLFYVGTVKVLGSPIQATSKLWGNVVDRGKYFIGGACSMFEGLNGNEFVLMDGNLEWMLFTAATGYYVVADLQLLQVSFLANSTTHLVQGIPHTRKLALFGIAAAMWFSGIYSHCTNKHLEVIVLCSGVIVLFGEWASRVQ